MSERYAASAPLALCAALLLGGCAVGPEHVEPTAPLPAAYLNAPAAAPAAAAADSAALAEFWRAFADPVLDRLVDAALATNTDVRIAQSRLTEARASLGETEAGALPVIGVEAAVTRGVAPSYELPGASRSERTATVYAPGVVMNWELDLFGRNRRATESAAAQVTAQELGVGAAQSAVVAAVAGEYLGLRGLQQRLQVAEAALANQRESLRLTEARLEVGRGLQFDVARARSQVAGTLATLPALQDQVARAVQRLATLTGRPAAELAPLLAEVRPLPVLPVTDLGALPLGAPEALLRRRPDIRAAERRAAAASALIGVATADLFPRLSLSGLLGLNARSVSDLGDSAAGVYSLGAALSWSPLDFGRSRARIRAAEARLQTGLLQYEQTVLTALEETENALGGFTRSAQQAAALDEAARSADEAARIARARFAAGSSDLLAVLDAERQALSARDQWVQRQAGTAGALVEVYRALGGGWR